MSAAWSRRWGRSIPFPPWSSPRERTSTAGFTWDRCPMRAARMPPCPAVRWEGTCRRWGCGCAGSRREHPAVSTGAALTSMPWSGRTAMQRSCRSPLPQMPQRCAIRCPAISPTPTARHTASFGRTSTARPCSPDRSRASGHGTVPPSKPRSCASPTSPATSSSSSPWACRRRSTICRACLPLCRRMSSWRFCAPFGDWSTWRSCALPTPSSTTASTPQSCVPRWSVRKSPVCTAPDSSTAAPAMRRLRRRDWWQASTPHARCRARRRSSWTVRTPTSARWWMIW